MTSASFSSLPISSAQIANLDSLGYKQMTAIQAQGLPYVLQGKDLIAKAKTGSGKTATFGIGLLQKINPRFFGVQALVLCPTRELADQVGKELRKLARNTPNIKLVLLCGGKPFGPQKGSLEHGAHIVVGTPGRIEDHLNRGTLVLAGLHTLVLDEADRMLDMGFFDVINEIIEQTPSKRQTLLFSATYPSTIKKMCASILNDPVTISVESEHTESVIEQTFYPVKSQQRNKALLALFEHYQPETTVVFCHTKIQCDEVARDLHNHQIEALAIHGDLEQRERDQVLVRFANHSCSVLVATDVAARGLDIKSLQAVINFELPRDPDIYVHRIGRTGRAGEKGIALSLYTEQEHLRVRAIEDYQNKPCQSVDLDTLKTSPGFSLQSPMVTLQLDAGRKNKIRPGDLLGALTGDAGLSGSQIGKVDIFDISSYVAIERSASRKALNYFANGKVKGRSVRARMVVDSI
ncbi:ATP-independent RNA helicase DbpA [Bathymodiolus platifrons methanotrophic gill symbiont]|uniref:ATP-dependent RNA helicase DbpA n=1 Tax=Bathymodiolus platifrons methanotrophic gill symbiont TaxID=113268 RepID=UPI0011CB9CF1|nr:ATP-dependent RNA helicase DbpA [Bathymodiolus platifrons methanotrophic gill symbiont]TXK99661.1 ATP-dependent RNA helicase DbpA [Methylococcaceae bacterium HT1]TXL16700.1 ATP-dependent RNA helicase DbpA [Methylococcaceae bacterium HT3]GFO74091.1 ATP-independent RNA helicase DbpA [Bathymodiolus platifrons methanotrophic gill symbiont]